MSDPEIHPVVRHMAARDSVALALGVEVLEARPGFARCAMTITDRHLNPHGVCHGGVLFTFADSTFGYACNAYDQVTLAQGADIDFLRPGRAGDRLIAVAEERARAGRSGVYDVTVTAGSGEIVAMMRGRSRVVGGAILPEGAVLPEDQPASPGAGSR
ncbi:MAG TPA: hydroxyphenylacetyl-CoA thioesterase PaaI [Thalassobaculum sp.]